MPRDREHNGAEGRGLRLESRIGAATAIAFLLVLVVSPSAAQTVLESSGAPATVTASDKDLYDIDAGGTDVRFVLEMLARNSGANIVVSPEVTGQVNAHLKRMTVDAILESLSTAAGFGFQKKGDTYLVVGKDKLEKPRPDPAANGVPEKETLVWQCRHAKPADLVGMLAKLFPNLACAEGPGLTTPQLDTSSGGLGTGGGGPSTTEKVRLNADKIVVVGSPSEIARARDVLSKLDLPRRQVAIDVTITEITTSGSRDLGIDWSWTDLGLKETNDSGIGFGKFTKPGMTVTAVLAALIKDGKANLLAQPNISVIDGEFADILIGDRILYPKLIGYNQIGAPIYDKAEEKVGIYLQIAPKVAGEGEIVLTLYPQVSLVTGFLKTAAGDYPQISTREARTTVSVRSGKAIAIGGLLRSNEINNGFRFPLLADIPIIGHMFRHDRKTKERTEIVILLSPRIVENSHSERSEESASAPAAGPRKADSSLRSE